MIKRNNLDLNSIFLQQLFNYFLVFRTFIQYCDVKALMSINNILSYEFKDCINLKIKQYASFYLFSQIISSNYYRSHYL